MSIRMNRSLRVALVCAVLCSLCGCDQLTGTSEGKLWSIKTEQGKDAPRLTLTTEVSATDTAGKTFPLELQLSGEGGSEWAANFMRQSVVLKLIAIGGPPMPEGVIMLVPDGNKRNPFGAGDAGSEVRQTPKGAVTCPTLTAVGAAATVRALQGSRFVDGSIGTVKFQIDDERVRAMAELLRRIDATAPK